MRCGRFIFHIGNDRWRCSRSLANRSNKGTFITWVWSSVVSMLVFVSVVRESYSGRNNNKSDWAHERSLLRIILGSSLEIYQSALACGTNNSFPRSQRSAVIRSASPSGLQSGEEVSRTRTVWVLLSFSLQSVLTPTSELIIRNSVMNAALD